eukprot:19178-Eustigmatos_ZCMA.PRE.1
MAQYSASSHSTCSALTARSSRMADLPPFHHAVVHNHLHSPSQLTGSDGMELTASRVTEKSSGVISGGTMLLSSSRSSE